MFEFLKNVKIGTKILLVILAVSLGSLLIIFAVSYTEMLNLTEYSQEASLLLGETSSEKSEEALLDLTKTYLTKLTAEEGEAVNDIFTQINAEISYLKSYEEALYANEEDFSGWEMPLPYETSLGIASSKYMLAPGVEETASIQEEVLLLSNNEYTFSGVFENNGNLSNIYVGTCSGISYRYSKSNVYDETYDPREREWFQKAVEAEGDVVWLDTYTDIYGETGITCASAFYGTDGEIIGVIATDISLESLTEEIEASKVGEDGYVFVLDSDGTYIAHPDYMTEGFVTEPLTNCEDEEWKNILLAMSAGATGEGVATVDGVESYISYTEIPEVSWSVGIVVPVTEIIAPASSIKELIISYTEMAQEYIQNTLSRVLIQFILLFIICAVVLVCCSILLSNAIVKPIKKLVSSMKKIGSGNLDIHIEDDSEDEVGQLAKACNKMTEDLKEHIQKLVVSEREKEKLNGELGVAANIQHSMLPALFPEFVDRTEFEIYATMDAAKEVGGDFYDFFFIDETHLAMVMADVSGKGIPAALFMVIAKTLLKTQSQELREYSPKEVLEKVNNQLCENNEAKMFVTVWFGILDIKTGKVISANAGHEYPAIYRKNGEFKLLKGKNGFVLAGMENMKYREVEFALEEGDKLYLYTDGVPEATNAKEEMYGIERMMTVLCRLKEETPEKILEGVKVDVDRFVGEAAQFDDMTMLALHYKGGN